MLMTNPLLVFSFHHCLFQDHHTVGIAPTNISRDYDNSNQLPVGDKSKQFITSTVADDSMVCLSCIAMCVY